MSSTLLPPREWFAGFRPQLSYEWHIDSSGDCRINFSGRIASRQEFTSSYCNPLPGVFILMLAQPFHFLTGSVSLD